MKISPLSLTLIAHEFISDSVFHILRSPYPYQGSFKETSTVQPTYPLDFTLKSIMRSLESVELSTRMWAANQNVALIS